MSDVTSITLTPLIAGSHPAVTMEVTIATGQNLAVGSVLGVITASGQYVLCAKAGTDDGRRTAKAVLGKAINTTTGAATGLVILHGEVDVDQLVFAADNTIDDHRAALIAAGVFPVDRK